MMLHFFSMTRPLHDAPAALALAASRRAPSQIIRALLDAYDDAAIYTDEDGTTALHCSIVSSTTVDDGKDEDDVAGTNAGIILDAYPDAASLPDKVSGRLPLHYAASVQIASALIVQFSKGIGARDKMGRIPLHWAVDPDRKRGGVSPALIKLLVEEGKKGEVELDTAGGDGITTARDTSHGGVLLEDSAGKSPLDLLCDRIVETFRRDESTFRLLPLCIEGTKQWEALTIMIIHGATSQSEDQFRMVHKVVELGLPPPVVSHALRTYPNHATERDSRGRTPLMIAASSLRRSDSADVVHALLNDPDHGCRKAARITDGEGRLPIDAAGENGHDEKVCDLLARAEPRAVDTRDLRDRMFPFMTAAVGEKSDLTSVYHLLRETPHVMTYLLKNLEK